MNVAKELKEGKFKRLEGLTGRFEELRKLAVELRKSGLTVSDALKGLEAYVKLERAGVKPEDVSLLTEAVRRIESEGYRAGDLVPMLVELVRLERDVGKPILEAAEEAKALAARLEELKGEVVEVESRLRQFKDLAEAFVELGVGKEDLKGLLELRKSLEGAGVDVKELREDVKKLIELRMEVVSLSTEVKRLREEALAISPSIAILKSGHTCIPCKTCGMKTIIVAVKRRPYLQMIEFGLTFKAFCHACWNWATYSPRDVLSQIALELMPA